MRTFYNTKEIRIIKDALDLMFPLAADISQRFYFSNKFNIKCSVNGEISEIINVAVSFKWIDEKNDKFSLKFYSTQDIDEISAKMHKEIALFDLMGDICLN